MTTDCGGKSLYAHPQGGEVIADVAGDFPILCTNAHGDPDGTQAFPVPPPFKPLGYGQLVIGKRIHSAVALDHFGMLASGNVGEVILEWGFEQLKAAGSIDRLLKYKIRPSNIRHKRS